MNDKEIHTIIGIIGNAFHLLISLSKLPMYMDIHKNKKPEDDTDLYYAFYHMGTMIKYILWILYGLPFVSTDSILITTSNGLGYIVEFIYAIIVFGYYEDKLSRYEKISKYLILTIFWPCSAFWMFLASNTLVHFSSVISAIYVYSLPFTMDRHMPVWMLLGNIIEAGLWIAFSLIYKFDIFVCISYSFGIFLSVIQLIHYTCTTIVVPIDSEPTLEPHLQV